MAEIKLTLNHPDEVVIRMYGQGFGDCFLLAFPRAQANNSSPDLANPVYVVIDSGVFYGTPGDKDRMRMVARSLNKATAGVVDLLIATHEHHDHLCGFEYAKEEWQEITVQRVWVGWTEDVNHPATQQYDHEKQTLERQAKKARQLVEARHTKDPALAAELFKALAGFAGDDLPAVLERGPKKLSKTPQVILFDLANHPGKRFKPGSLPTKRDFCEPGQIRTIPQTKVEAYVLGPPTDGSLLGLEFLESEVYSPEGQKGGAEHDAARSSGERFALAAASDRAERLSLGSALEVHVSHMDDESIADSVLDQNAPFRAALSLRYTQACQDPFFQQHYFDVELNRQIETDWLRGAGRLALQLDNLTNNTSLVLAFRLPDERVLLFVGDAQVGNWLSWQQLTPQDWRRPDGGQVTSRPTVADLLAHTVVYKVGHHGSHNATLKTKGLEMMPDNLIAFVPTSRKIPQLDNKPPWAIPLDSLMRRLQEKSGGRIIFPHNNPDYPLNPTFTAQVEATKDMLPAMEREDDTGQREIIEAPVPLWRQVRI